MIQNNPALPSATIEQKPHSQVPPSTITWKPSELEAAVLKLHFQNNKYPTADDKESIAQMLQEKFNSKVDRDQIARWFKYEREKATKKAAPESSGHTYKKFSVEELEYLNTNFTEDNYPRLETMISMSKHLKVSLSKIENWYKHSRRTLAKRGELMLKTKKYFKSDELNYLNEMFEKHSCPTKKQIREIAENLNCNETQIKNWYSNRKKKFRSDLRKNNLDFADDKLQETKLKSVIKIDLPREETSVFNETQQSFAAINGTQPSTALNLSLLQPVIVLNNGLPNTLSQTTISETYTQLLKNIPQANISHNINQPNPARQLECPQVLPNTNFFGPIGAISPAFCPTQNITNPIQPILIRTTSPHISSPALVSPQLSSHIKPEFSYTFGYPPTLPNNNTFLSNNFSLVSTPSSISSHVSSTPNPFLTSSIASKQAPSNQLLFSRSVMEDSPIKKRFIVPYNEVNFAKNFELGQRVNVVPH